MLGAYVPILALVLVAVGIAVFVIIASSLLGPRKSTARKLAPYESGMEPIGPAMRRMPVKFYVVAMSFILFDIEVIFFFPYALIFRPLGVYGLLAMGFFFVILLIGFLYEWRRGMLSWD